jgi:Lipase (class 3)
MSTAARPTITADEKVVFLLSYLSNLASYLTGPYLDYGLYSSVVAGLVKTATPWKIVWGPAVLQYPADGYALNAMYVASPIGQPGRFVAAVAGTNIPSAVDWFLEDFNVSIQVPWPAPPAAGGPAISLATASGVSILLTMKPSAGLPGAGLTLPEFLRLALRGQAAAEVETTGHSLGGALVPTLALWLADQQGTPTGWDPQGVATVSTMPTAGATPGNLDFANYYDSRLGANTQRFINSLDPVPHWWNLATMGQLPALYAPAIPESPGIDNLVKLATAVAAKGDYAPIVPAAPPIQGAINASIVNPGASAAANYFAQMGYQHTTAYYLAFGLPSSVIPMAPLAVPPPSPKARTVAISTGKRMMAVGSSIVEMPKGADDPRTPGIVAELVGVLQGAGEPGY